MIELLWPASAGLILLALLWLLLRREVTPEEVERHRRLKVHASGRITDGVITENRVTETPDGFRSLLVHYTYDVRGVGYSASQDITSLQAYLDRDPGRIAGTASVKYLPESPSNSIVICERWSGLR